MIEGCTVYTLRPMTSADLGIVLQWRNHPDIRRYMYTKHEIGLEEHREWYARTSADPEKCLLIFEVNDNAKGFVQFSAKHLAKVADWGFYIAPDAQKGTGRKMGFAALDFAFRNLMLDKIYGQAFSFNKRSIRFHLSLGFQQEGILREQVFNGERYHDVICFGLLAIEWLAEN